MGKKIDLTGQMYGRLTVLEDVGRQHGHVLWRCLCECGNTVDVMANSLQNGRTQSCGCLHKERASETSKIDLTGRIFGRLTVLEDVGRTKRQQVIWRCLCDCGNTVDVITASLRNGGTKSCGCLQKDRASEANKKVLVGQKFGRLTVLEDVGRKRKGVVWHCLCECGDIVEVMAGNLQSGNTQSCGCYKKEPHLGEKNSNWKGGITSIAKAIRNCMEYKDWRKEIFQRDDFTCQHCNQIGRKLRAHHIKRFSVILEEFNITTFEEAQTCVELWDTNNGITLCKKCHKKEHSRSKEKF